MRAGLDQLTNAILAQRCDMRFTPLMHRFFLVLVAGSLLAHDIQPLVVPDQGRAGFTSIDPASTGIRFTNTLTLDRQLTNQILLNGSGVAAGDVDGDGWCDLYFCGLDGDNALYRNLGGWRFQDVTQQAGLACPGLDATAAALLDFDGDGDLDLLVNSVGGGTHIFLNEDSGRFRQATPPRGLNPGGGGTSLAVGDFDLDGFLDFYIGNYRTSALMDMPETHFQFRTINDRRVISHVNGQPASAPEWAGRFRINERGGIEENGEPDLLYRNVGGTNVYSFRFPEGRFLDEEGRPITEPLLEWALSAMFRDFNRDGLPDLYVCNDFEAPDRVWINLGDGRFRLIHPTAFRKSSQFSMGVDVADINRDGLDDILVLDMLSRDHLQRMDMLPERGTPMTGTGDWMDRPGYMMNTLFLNGGDGWFTEIAQLSGLDASEWSWAVVFLDVDLDGYEDVLISNGHARAGRSMDVAAELKAMRTQRRMTPAEILEARRIYPTQSSVNLAFRNRGDLTFEETSRAWGFVDPTVSHGMALADLDNDGDLDLIVNNLNHAAGVFRNESAAPRVAVRLRGLQPNTRGIGARLTVRGGPVEQSQEMICAGRYLSSDEPIRVFAAGSLTNGLQIEVDWPSGRRSVVDDVPANSLCVLDEAEAQFRVGPPNPVSPVAWWRGAGTEAFFQEVEIGHIHVDKLFDDFVRRPLLSKRLSQLGPGVAWFDLDGDSLDDLLVGSGAGGRLAALRNNGRGGFERSTLPIRDSGADLTTLIGLRAEGLESVLVGQASYELDQPLPPIATFPPEMANLVRQLPALPGSVGPLASADLDGDGDLDLFVGCRVGKYPSAPGSYICKLEQGVWQIDPKNSAALANVGLVSGAVWSDLDADGDPDLVLACEWGPVRVFGNERGRLTERTAALGLAAQQGWWNGVATGDFDGDGRLDIVASNWGRNTPYQAHREKPLRLYHDDVDDNGTVELVEAYYDSGLQRMVPVRQRDALAVGLPSLIQRYPSNREFAQATVEEILGPEARFLQANWLESTLFLNRGDRFVAKPLPAEAQMAPGFGVVVADFDGDGDEDLFLSQNFFDTVQGVPRYDGGRGLWLRGDGRGGFTAVPGRVSGLKIYGEQRGAAVSDYDQDGRSDLVVTQNGGPTKLYRNRAARRGVRVRLRGPKANPDGIGACVAVGDSKRLGPVREVQAGSGYWSQNSAVQVPAFDGEPTRVWVRWPGGKVTETAVDEQREVVVHHP